MAMHVWANWIVNVYCNVYKSVRINVTNVIITTQIGSLKLVGAEEVVSASVTYIMRVTIQTWLFVTIRP